MKIVSTGSILLVALAVTNMAAASAETERLDQLETRVEQIEGGYTAPVSANGFADNLSEWTRRFHLSGNGDLSYLYGQENSKAARGRFAVENARLFFEVDLGGEVRLFDRTAMEASGLVFEWQIFHKAKVQNDVGSVGSLYLRMNSLGGSGAFNLKFGRFALPFGEEYVRFHEQRADNPLISFSTAMVYGLDEGILLYGSLAKGVQYMFAVTDGDEEIGANSTNIPAVTGKLVYEPLSWLKVSVSGHRTGPLSKAKKNDPFDFAMSALMFGEFAIYPIVPFAGPLFQDGEAATPDPSLKLDDVYAFEGDVVLHDARFGRLWLSYGRVFVEAESDKMYDRDMHYWTAEGVFELGAVCEPLDKFYVALRYSAIGTLDDDEGWRLRVMNNGGNLGYNVKLVQSVNAGIGLRLNEHVTIKTEFSRFDFDLVKGTGSTFDGLVKKHNYGGIAATLEF